MIIEALPEGLGPGAVVQLRSGGPEMTVLDIERPMPTIVLVNVLWFNNGEIRQAKLFPCVFSVILHGSANIPKADNPS